MGRVGRQRRIDSSGRGYQTANMPDEITALREEMAALRAEFNALRLEHRKLLSQVGVWPDDEEEPWPEYLQIEASCLIARDDKMQIPLRIDGEGANGSITFMDKNHCTRIEIACDEDGPRFEMRNAKGELIFQIAEARDGTGQLCVCDADGKPRTGMRVSEFGGVVNVLDKEVKPQVILTGTDDGGQIHVVNAMHHSAASLKATERGGIVSVNEPSGQLMGFLFGESGSGQLTVNGPQGEQAVGIAGTEDGGGIVVFDVDGKPKAHLPDEEE